MRVLGIDVGTVRVGLAISDQSNQLAVPLETINISDSMDKPEILARYAPVFSQIKKLILEHNIEKIIVGLPLNLQGKYTKSTYLARDFAKDLESFFPQITVILNDERMTTNISLQQLRASGVKRKKHKGLVDQLAAVEILQSWLTQQSVNSSGPEEESDFFQ